MDDHQEHEHEHEVYGGEIPDMEGDEEMLAAEGDGIAEIDPNSREESLEDMKKRLKEIEEEASALRDMQARVEKEMGANQDDSSSAAATQIEKEEVDSRSIYVGNFHCKRVFGEWGVVSKLFQAHQNTVLLF
ncbi:hypothetical protein IEQ34_007967 [Dendrobium chrysotoxum]|uniref:Polyadenylate-binding protein n=1 Tax=Dendrobium chrysotoxum TaxID=161865 RepID=A0AAV7H787_DENCH|nr:hypothetical protein IEQ34_007967 [Dendrobium chrysotoxum]